MRKCCLIQRKNNSTFPTGPVQLGDGQSGKKKIVGQEGQSGVLLGIEIGVGRKGLGLRGGSWTSGRQNGLVVWQSGRWLEGTWAARVDWNIFLAGGDEEG